MGWLAWAVRPLVQWQLGAMCLDQEVVDFELP
jgi:hypothetical protein